MARKKKLTAEESAREEARVKHQLELAGNNFGLTPRRLDNVEQLTSFLSDLTWLALKYPDEFSQEQFKTCQKLVETLFKVIKEAHAQSPDGQKRELNKALVAATLAKGLPADVAMRALREQNLLHVQDYAMEAVTINAKDVTNFQPERISGVISIGPAGQGQQNKPKVEDLF